MKKLLLVAILSLPVIPLSAQTCTLSGSTTWPFTCVEGGSSSTRNIIVVPAGTTLNFDSNNAAWTGLTMEILGTVNINANNISINADILVRNGGRLNIGGSLAMGTNTPTCDYSLTLNAGAIVNVSGTGSDRLTICGSEIMKGAGACNSCGGTNSGQCAYNGQPYCEPASGFTGPTGFDEDGYNPTLPVKLLYFSAQSGDEGVVLDWATSMEENFSKFVVQRSDEELLFKSIGEVAGKGFDIHNVESKYSFTDKAPLSGFNYYRLKAVDLDESYEYFGPKLVKVDGPRNVVVYPNPASGEEISLRYNFHPQESDRIVVLNSFGVEICNVAATATDKIVFPEKLSPGIYLVRYRSGSAEQVNRIVVRD